MRSVSLVVCCVILLCAPSCSRDRQQPSAAASRAVQAFYDRYVRLAANAAWYEVLNDTTTILAPELVSALRADHEAAVRNTQGIVGLAWDPFLGSQDPCDSYVVGRTSQTGERYLVEVHAICAGKRDAAPAVIAELLQRDHSWIMVNVRYPDHHGDLLTDLRELAHHRARISADSADSVAASKRPNKRLKLTGGDRSKGSSVLCAGAHELSFTYAARGGRVARSLSAIR